MKSVTAAEMRELDRRTIEEFGTPGNILMERAGAGVAGSVHSLLSQYHMQDAQVLLIAGKGNNGGDVFAAAPVLREIGLDVTVWLAAHAKDIKGDALTHLEHMNKVGIPLRELPDETDWEAAAEDPFLYDLIVDGLLGTGSSGAPRGVIASAIRFINDHSEQALVAAIDLPSGLDADTGKPQGDTVIADLTVTMALPKKGLLMPAALEFVGNLRVVDIGIPNDYVQDLPSEEERIEWLHPAEMGAMLPRRRRTSHKGTFGHVLLVGGAKGYSGAIILAAKGALRSGVGLVSVLTPKSVAPAVRAALPEVMVHEGWETDKGSLDAHCIEPWIEKFKRFSALLVGPGLTTHSASIDLIAEIIRFDELPMVMDADGLNVLMGRAELLRNSPAKMVLTPHPGEMSRLLGCGTDDVQRDRLAVAKRCAESTGEVTVLKGAGTIIAEHGKAPAVNLSGNPGMAKGGTGDVLGGLITGFLGQGMSCFEAAKLGVYIHGRAGDLAASWAGQIGMTADDVVEQIPHALKEIKLR